MDISTLFCKRESVCSFVYAALSAYCVPFPVLGSEGTVAKTNSFCGFGEHQWSEKDAEKGIR